MNPYGKGRHTYMIVLLCVQNILLRNSAVELLLICSAYIAMYRGSKTLSLQHCSSFTFGVENALVSSI